MGYRLAKDHIRLFNNIGALEALSGVAVNDGDLAYVRDVNQYYKAITPSAIVNLRVIRNKSVVDAGGNTWERVLSPGNDIVPFYGRDASTFNRLKNKNTFRKDDIDGYQVTFSYSGWAFDAAGEMDGICYTAYNDGVNINIIAVDGVSKTISTIYSYADDGQVIYEILPFKLELGSGGNWLAIVAESNIFLVKIAIQHNINGTRIVNLDAGVNHPGLTITTGEHRAVIGLNYFLYFTTFSDDEISCLDLYDHIANYPSTIQSSYINGSGEFYGITSDFNGRIYASNSFGPYLHTFDEDGYQLNFNAVDTFSGGSETAEINEPLTYTRLVYDGNNLCGVGGGFVQFFNLATKGPSYVPNPALTNVVDVAFGGSSVYALYNSGLAEIIYRYENNNPQTFKIVTHTNSSTTKKRTLVSNNGDVYLLSLDSGLNECYVICYDRLAYEHELASCSYLKVDGAANFLYLNASGYLRTSGGEIHSAIRTITDSEQLVEVDRTILCNHTTPITVTLPVISYLEPSIFGFELIIKDISGDASTNNITINADTGTIEGGSAIINTDYGIVKLMYVSNDFWIKL